MKKKAILLIIIGILIMAYPLISNIILSSNQSSVILSYQETIAKMTEEEIETEKEKVKQYNDGLTSSSITVDNTDTTKGISYLNVLNIGNVIGYISIPIINLYLPIYHGTSDEVLESGIGHLEESSLPIGQIGTHAVFLGHTGLVRTKMFDDLNKIELGDKFYIYVLDEKYSYEVDQIVTITPDEISDYTKIEEEYEYVTLITCTPYGVNTHRLLVRGIRVEDTEEIDEKIDSNQKSNSSKKSNSFNFYLIICIIILLILVVIIIIVLKRNKKLEKEKRKRKQTRI